MTDPEPGYYWARTRTESEADQHLALWEPIEITEGLDVLVTGEEVPSTVQEWELGPRLEPPEEEK